MSRHSKVTDRQSDRQYENIALPDTLAVTTNTVWHPVDPFPESIYHVFVLADHNSGRNKTHDAVIIQNTMTTHDIVTTQEVVTTQSNNLDCTTMVGDYCLLDMELGSTFEGTAYITQTTACVKVCM